MELESLDIKIEDHIFVCEEDFQSNVKGCTDDVITNSGKRAVKSGTVSIIAPETVGSTRFIYEVLPNIKSEPLEDDVDFTSQYHVDKKQLTCLNNKIENKDHGATNLAEKIQVLKEWSSPSSSDGNLQCSEDDSKKERRFFKCKVCSKSFKSVQSRDMHCINSHYPRKFNKCDVCEKVCKSIADLRKHFQSHLRGNSFACDFCTKTFPAKMSLVIHRRSHTGEKPYLCEVCGQQFSQCGDMTIHMTIHTGKKNFKCSCCEKEFRKSGDLYRHIRRMHTREELFPCDACGKKMATPGELVSHRNRVHFPCDFCSKKLATSADLVRHLRKHTGEIPFQCEVCGKGFSENWLVSRHKRTVHEAVGGQYCGVCKTPYKVECGRKGHSRVTGSEIRDRKESIHSCETCGARFLLKSSLNIHLRKHTGEKPFQCGGCERNFASSSDRSKHLRETGHTQ